MRKLLLAAIILILFATTQACVPGTSSSMQIVVDFRDSAGLFVGNDVGILGVTVGKVTGIEPAGQVVKVTLEVDGNVKVPVGVGAVVVSRSVATDRYVELTPVYDGGPLLPSGATIPVGRTKTPVDFEEVLKSINEFATGISGSKETTQAVRRFLQVGAKTFGKNGPAINLAVTTLGTAVDSISGQRTNFVQTMAGLDTLTTALAQNQQVLSRFLSSAAKSTELLAGERGNLRNALTTLRRAMATVASYASTNRELFKGTISDVTSLTNTLLARREQLSQFIELMPLVAQNLVRAIPGGDAQIRAPISSIIGGPTVQRLCQQLGGPLCDVVGTDPTTPFGGLVGPLLNLLGPVKR